MESLMTRESEERKLVEILDKFKKDKFKPLHFQLQGVNCVLVRATSFLNNQTYGWLLTLEDYDKWKLKPVDPTSPIAQTHIMFFRDSTDNWVRKENAMSMIGQFYEFIEGSKVS